MRRARSTAACALALGLALGACAPGTRSVQAPVTPAGTAGAAIAPAAEPDAQAGLAHLRAAYVAFLEDHELEPLSSLYAPELEVRAARRAAEGVDRETSFDRAKFVAVRIWAARHEPTNHARVDRVELRKTGDATATVDWELTLDRPGAPDNAAAFGERYDLVRRGGAWLIVRFRYWPLLPDTMKEFGAAFFSDLDAKIDSELAGGDERRAVYDLMVAYRFEDCAALARVLTKNTPEEPWVWQMRAKASAMVGDIDDAETSLARESALGKTGAP